MVKVYKRKLGRKNWYVKTKGNENWERLETLGKEIVKNWKEKKTAIQLIIESRK